MTQMDGLTMRLLVTGSRDWDDRVTIEKALLEAWEDLDTPIGLITLVSGACPTGADKLCESIWRYWAGPVERHSANWKTLGKRAGFVRNAEMVNLGADLCLAFIKNNSRGATMTANLARDAGIQVREFRA